MCRPKTDPTVRSISRPIAVGLAAVALGTMLAGCSDLYFDHRDTISQATGDAIAANEVAQTIDPWPAQSGNPNLAAQGQRMQSAIERYRTNIVTQPVDPMLMEGANQMPATSQPLTNSNTTPTPPSIAPGTTSTTTTVVTAAPSQ
jgi:hypothetical protein